MTADRGEALYRRGDFAAARDELVSVVVRFPQEAGGWALLGRVHLHLGRRKEAEAALARAARLDPRVHQLPVRLSHRDFEALVERAWEEIPPGFRERLANLILAVEDLPSVEDVREGNDPDLLGEYDGATVYDETWPQRIVLYQLNLENVCGSREELWQEVRDTIRHEVGHHFGLDEDELP